MPKLPSLRGCLKRLAELNPHTPVLVHGDNGMAPGISVLLGRSHVLHDTGQPGRELGLGTAEGERLGGHGVQVERPGAEHAADRSWACCTERRESAEREISGALVTPQKGPARGEGPSPSLTAVITSLRVSSDPVAHLKYVRLLFKK